MILEKRQLYLHPGLRQESHSGSPVKSETNRASQFRGLLHDCGLRRMVVEAASCARIRRLCSGLDIAALP